MASYDWLLALGFIFGFSFVLSVLSEFSFATFMGYLTMFTGFMVWIDFLPLWTLVLEILILVFIAIIEIQERSGI